MHRFLSALHRSRVLVTGAHGMLGSAFVESLHVHVPTAEVIGLSHGELDVCSADQVMRCASHRPDIIVHCAGMTDAEQCEREPDAARESHVNGTRNVVALASAVGARLLYPQSVFIFDGTELPVTERTQPAPLFEYGRAKLDAEGVVRAELDSPLVVRMAGFFGGDDKDKNFVGKFVRVLRDLVRRGQTSVDIGDRVWQPTYTLDLALNCLLLLAQEHSGVYHMGSIGEASFHEVAAECVRVLDLDDRVSVLRAPAERFGRHEAARRPLRMVTRNERLDAEGLNLQRPWRDALQDYLGRPYFDMVRNDLNAG